MHGEELEEMEYLAGALDAVAVRASAAVARGQLALAESRHEEAALQLRRGWREWTEVHTPYEASQARALLAEAHLALGDAESAESELAAAQAGFSRIGATREAQRIGALMAVPMRG
jgi:thioredoxin-like negative regulator of GroEL